MAARKINLVEILSKAVEWRKFIIINFFVICFVTAVFTLIAPKTFTATSVIVTPVDMDRQMNLTSLLNNMPLSAFGLPQATAELNLYLAILNSRELMEQVAEKFNLMERYGAEDMEATVKQLRNMFSTNLNDDGSLSISMKASTGFLSTEEEEDEARKRSAEMTNYVVELLDQKYKSLRNEQSTNNRRFVEKRYHENLEELRKAEEDFKEFQDQHGLIALPEQTEAAITAMSEIRAQMIAKEIEIGMLSQYVQKDHVELERKKFELEELKKKYREFYSSSSNGVTQTDLFIPFEKLPDLGLQYLRLYREVKLQEKLLEFILPLYEQAKIQEVKNSQTVQVLDSAVPPVLRTSPKRSITVLLMGFLSLIFSAVWIMVSEYFGSLGNSNEDARKWQRIRQELRSDLNTIFRRRHS